jgi:isoquinoline 1-oxidoreductase alpha subunit
MIELSVNGQRHSLDIEPEMPLFWAIRDEIGPSCGIAEWGGCTVPRDGVALRSSSLPVGRTG